MKNIIIIGGGLAGLITSIGLARSGFACTIIEKKSYPFHRVCGEYVSNETIPFLKSSGLYPDELKPVSIDKLQLTSVAGRSSIIDLDLGGFGISRFNFDNFLFEIAKKEGVSFLLNTEVESLDFINNEFILRANNQELIAPMVIGSFGKRSKLDAQLNRLYLKKDLPMLV